MAYPADWLKRWVGYSLDVFGAVVNRRPQTRQEYPVWHLTFDETETFVQVWRLRAVQQGARLCAEVTWDSELGVYPVIREVEAAWYKPEWNPTKDLQSAGRAMRLLYAHILRGGGRPADFATPQDAETALTTIVQAIRRDKQREATRQLAAEYLDEDPARRGRKECDPRQVDRYLARFWSGDWESWIRQLPWPESS